MKINDTGITTNSLITAINNLANNGMTDIEIGKRLNKHPKTIIYHRRKHNISSGRSCHAVFTKENRKRTMNTRSYKMPEIFNVPGSRIKHGLNAYTPITCKGGDCPYKVTCDISDIEPFIGKPCIAEAAIIASLFVGYCREFQVDENDIANLTRIRHLIDLDIKLIRCNRLTAQYPALVCTVWDKGEGLSWNIINPIARYNILLMNERRKVLKGLIAERVPTALCFSSL